MVTRTHQNIALSAHRFSSFPCLVNRLKPKDPYMGRTAPLTSKPCILYIYSTNIYTEYFKHALYSPFSFSLQNAVCFIMLTCFFPVLFTFYIQGVLKFKKNNSGAKRLNFQISLYLSASRKTVCQIYPSISQSIHLNFSVYWSSVYALTHPFIHSILPKHYHSYLLTPWSTVLLEKLTGFHLVKKFPTFYGTSLPHSQVLAPCPYPEPPRSSPCSHIPLPEDPS